MTGIIYKLADGRLWDVDSAEWISFVMGINGQEQKIPQGNVIDLVSADGNSDVEYLVKTLAFYNYPLGELVIYSAKGIKEELARLDNEYLTPRTLAGLSSGDEKALARWNEHEEKAIPLRTRLKELEADNA